MPISLDKVSQEAPHLLSLVKNTLSIAAELGLDPDVDKAEVMATIDDSGSAAPLFSNGTVQRTADLSFAASNVFDDDGKMPVSFFSSSVKDLGEITLLNSKGFIHRQHPRWGGTKYVLALKWIIETAGYSAIDLGKSGGMFSGDKLELKASRLNPVYAIFITDGNPEDGDAATELIKRMSQLPIFIQFVGVGNASFSYLDGLNKMKKGRFIDNVGFVDSKNTNGEDDMLRKLLNEFPDYLKQARKLGLVTS